MIKEEEGALRADVLEYAANLYGTAAEYLWKAYPGYAVFRHPNKKWYGAVMNVEKSKLGLRGNVYIDILAVKCEAADVAFLSGKTGFLPAYHMNKKNWISVILDGSVKKDVVFAALDKSYFITSLSCGKKFSKADNIRNDK